MYTCAEKGWMSMYIKLLMKVDRHRKIDMEVL